MRTLLLGTILFPLLSSAQQTCPALVWSDEFDGTELDATNWAPQIGDGCSLGQDLCGWGNAEAQYYRAENAVVSNGTLKVIAKQEEFGGLGYTSARLRTLGLVDIDLTQSRLRLEARIKVPYGASKGLWPAFWMLPSNFETSQWPLGGEIDIMEFIGREPNNAQGYLHYGNQWADRSSQGGPLWLPEEVGNDFRVYSIEKSPNQIDFFVDSHLYQSYSASDIEPKFNWPFENTFHFILNLAVGGHWPEYPNEETVFPNQMEVDYVRVYDLQEATVGRITGSRLVRVNQTNEVYCVEGGISYTNVAWTVPDGATFADSSTTNCITVNFGMASGFVQAIAESACDTQTLRIPVKVHPFYEKEFAFLAPGTDDQASLLSATGTFNVVNGTIEYGRNIAELYDHFQLSTTSISDPNAYVNGDKKFYMDLKSPTAAPCTRILIQLEDSSIALPDNYPVGRHSRYIAFLEGTADWQRLEFDFYDEPGLNVANVDRILVLLDSFVERADEYSFRNLDSAVIGCTADCEALSTNTCRKKAKSEKGACADGINNDGFGFDGDGTTDCEDSDCWDDPACSIVAEKDASPPPSPGISSSFVPTAYSDETSTMPTLFSESNFPTTGTSQAPTFELTSGASSTPIGVLTLLGFTFLLFL
jgi:beta-glucanase (GH16 family)